MYANITYATEKILWWRCKHCNHLNKDLWMYCRKCEKKRPRGDRCFRYELTFPNQETQEIFVDRKIDENDDQEFHPFISKPASKIDFAGLFRRFESDFGTPLPRTKNRRPPGDRLVIILRVLVTSEKKDKRTQMGLEKLYQETSALLYEIRAAEYKLGSRTKDKKDNGRGGEDNGDGNGGGGGGGGKTTYEYAPLTTEQRGAPPKGAVDMYVLF